MEIKAGSGLDWNDATGTAFAKNDIVWTDFAEVRSALSLISKPRGSCPVLASTGQCHSVHSEGPPV